MAKKLTKRKAVSFLRSYYDVLNEIPKNDDKLSFLLSVLDKLFIDKDPVNLNFIVNLSYESQRHSIEKSVKGYKDKTKQDLIGNPLKSTLNNPTQDPYQGGTEGCCQDPTQQEKEKEKEKEVYNTLSKDKIDFKVLLKYINTKTRRGFRTINDKVKKSFNARIKEGYTKEDIKQAIDNSIKAQYHKENNYQYLTPEFFSRSSTLDKYCNVSKIENKKTTDLSKWQKNPYNEDN